VVCKRCESIQRGTNVGWRLENGESKVDLRLMSNSDREHMVTKGHKGEERKAVKF